MQSISMSVFVCLSVHEHTLKTTCLIAKFSLHVAYGHDFSSWWQYNMLRTSDL